jgi:hypothetical protein
MHKRADLLAAAAARSRAHMVESNTRQTLDHARAALKGSAPRFEN